MGIQIKEDNTTTLFFVNDRVVLVQDADAAGYMTRKLVEEYKKRRLEINTDKTNYMAIGCEEEDLNMAGRIIKNTKYLEVTLTENGHDEKVIVLKNTTRKSYIKLT